MRKIKATWVFAGSYRFFENVRNLDKLIEWNWNCKFLRISNFVKLSKCKRLGYFLILFLEIIISDGCLDGVRQSLSFRNWFQILDTFGRWLLIIQWLISLIGVCCFSSEVAFIASSTFTVLVLVCEQEIHSCSVVLSIFWLHLEPLLIFKRTF